METLKKLIRHVPDYPKPGILFYDITTLLKDSEGFRQALDAMVEPYGDKAIDVVVGIESRGFIFGAAIADRLRCAFVPVRKPGKLPGDTVTATYDLEYGTDSLEIHRDAIGAGQQTLIVDDLLATGGTASATVGLVKQCGAEVVGVSLLIELDGLNGRSKLEGEEVTTVLHY